MDMSTLVGHGTFVRCLIGARTIHNGSSWVDGRSACRVAIYRILRLRLARGSAESMRFQIDLSVQPTIVGGRSVILPRWFCNVAIAKSVPRPTSRITPLSWIGSRHLRMHRSRSPDIPARSVIWSGQGYLRSMLDLLGIYPQSERWS